MGKSEAAVVEPCVIQTRYISGILAPVFDGQNWIVTVIERRMLDGEWCRVVVDRYALSEADLMEAVATAMTPLADRVCVPLVLHS